MVPEPTPESETPTEASGPQDDPPSTPPETSNAPPPPTGGSGGPVAPGSMSQQPLSPWAYMGVSGVGFLVAVGLLLFFVFQGPRLVGLGFDQRVFYFLLVPLGLATAAFTFGGMRSFASLTQNVLSGPLELGGPVVAALLVVVGGFFLVPESGPFALTVRVHGPDGRGDIVREGTVILDLGGDRRTRELGSDGGAVFSEIPNRFLGTGVSVFVEAPGYAQTGGTVVASIPPDRVLFVAMEEASYSTEVTGTVVGQDGGPLGGIVLNFRSGLAVDTTDANGNFRVVLPEPPGASVPVMALREGVVGYNDTFTVPERGGTLTIRFRGQ